MRLRDMIQKEFNDPEIFFLDEEDGFPLRARVSGEYYLGDRFYQSEDGEHMMSVSLHCLDHIGEDYVGMEMFVYLSDGQSEPTFETHFQSSVI